MTPAECVLIAARVVVGGAFLVTGLRNIRAHGDIAGLLAANRFPLPKLLAACGLAMQVGFGALMVSQVWPLVAALGLLAFTVMATLMAHSFWTFPAKEERMAQANFFLANTIMVGGLLALVAAAWPA